MKVKIRKRRLRAVLRRATKRVEYRTTGGVRYEGKDYWVVGNLHPWHSMTSNIMWELERWLPYCIEVQQ